LAGMGLTVLRFNSREVLKEIDAVVERIAAEIAKQLGR
jgi:very-short-patch-repair endonuclease